VNSETIRCLIDALNGGPPRAFECLMSEGFCGKVTRTLSGMKAHQRTVHKFVPQAELFKDQAKEEVNS
jgi:hypothetical protein